MAEHIVVQGEYLSKLARKYGFSNYGTIWDHPNNAELKKKRQNPNVLLPGDKLFIPPRESREESRPTEKKHRFQLKAEKLMLRIRFLGLDSKPVAGIKIDLTVDGTVTPLATAADGRVEVLLFPLAEKGSIQFKDERTPFEQQIPIELRVGHLDPIEDESGQRGRLNALGYDAGDPVQAGNPSLAFRSAVEEFQCDHGLTVDGVVGPQTRKKLQDAYGC